MMQGRRRDLSLRRDRTPLEDVICCIAKRVGGDVRGVPVRAAGGGGISDDGVKRGAIHHADAAEQAARKSAAVSSSAFRSRVRAPNAPIGVGIGHARSAAAFSISEVRRRIVR